MLLPTILSALLAIAPVSAIPHKRAVCTPPTGADEAGDDARAINTAIGECGAGGRIVLPANKTYSITGALDFTPCKSCELEINGLVQLVSDWDNWFATDAVFPLHNVKSVVISGSGTVDAQYFGLSPGSLVPFSDIKLFSFREKSSQITIKGIKVQNVPGTAFTVTGGSSDLHFTDIEILNEARIGYEIQDARDVYISKGIIRAGEICVRLAANSTDIQIENSTCIVNGTLNGGGRNSGIEFTFGSQANNVWSQWVRNVYAKGIKFIGDLDAVSFRGGSDKEVRAEVRNATFTDIVLEGPVRRPVYMGEGFFGDGGCGLAKCTKWNVTDVTLKKFAGIAVEHTALVCEESGDVCEFVTEGWNVTYT